MRQTTAILSVLLFLLSCPLACVGNSNGSISSPGNPSPVPAAMDSIQLTQVSPTSTITITIGASGQVAVSYNYTLAAARVVTIWSCFSKSMGVIITDGCAGRPISNTSGQNTNEPMFPAGNNAVTNMLSGTDTKYIATFMEEGRSLTNPGDPNLELPLDSLAGKVGPQQWSSVDITWKK
jgi:hypothetical protein